jgi:hypothetical protein
MEKELMHNISTTTLLHVMNGRISDLLIPVSEKKRAGIIVIRSKLNKLK